VSRTERKNGVTYRVKVKNASRFRNVVDLRVRARVHYRHTYSRTGTTVTRTVYLGTSPEQVHVLAPRANQIVRIDPGRISDRGRALLRSSGYQAASVDSLETLLTLLPEAFLSLHVVANDGWSGSTRFTESPHYRMDALEDAAFVVDRSDLDKRIRAFNRWRQRLGQRWLLRAARGHPELQPKLRAHDAES
jgi:hypothetical protein